MISNANSRVKIINLLIVFVTGWKVYRWYFFFGKDQSSFKSQRNAIPENVKNYHTVCTHFTC